MNVHGAELRMLAYNDSIPGPTLHVQQGSHITGQPRYDGDVETTVHWHGLRLENRYDGVPHETQQPIPVGGSYGCQVQFPDAHASRRPRRHRSAHVFIMALPATTVCGQAPSSDEL